MIEEYCTDARNTLTMYRNNKKNFQDRLDPGSCGGKSWSYWMSKDSKSTITGVTGLEGEILTPKPTCPSVR